MRWDIFCRVVDNFGDIGVCWRLAADLGARGESVRLWIDDDSALRWMAPQGAVGVQTRRWPDGEATHELGDVVVEAFGCDLPAPLLHRLAAQRPSPVWINLEYLSAEAFVDRSHGLPSPQMAGPAKGQCKWFYYPGFTPRSGGLLREPGLLAALAEARAQPLAGDAASVFCYANPMLARLAADWPGRLLLAPGPAQALQQANAEKLTWLAQPDYDRLLARCAVNFVRGEDSFVRAMWAARPFVWQIYPQHDGAHLAKLEAFLDRFLDGAEAGLGADVRRLWRAWNGLADWPARWPDREAWAAHCERWRDAQAARPDLTTRLLHFVGQKR